MRVIAIPKRYVISAPYIFNHFCVGIDDWRCANDEVTVSEGERAIATADPIKQQSTGKFIHVQKSHLILSIIDYYYFISIDVNPTAHQLFPPVHILFRYFKHTTCGGRLGIQQTYWPMCFHRKFPNVLLLLLFLLSSLRLTFLRRRCNMRGLA